MIFIDFEVFAYDWLCVCIDPAEGRKVIINDRDELRTYYEAHKTDVWVGFNIRHYDQYIFKGIMLDMDPKRLNDFIIVEGNEGWKYSDEFRKVPLYFYDVMNAIDRGLKYFEGSMGSDIKESSVPFDIKRIYYLYDVPGGESRGGHAHKKLYQLIIAASGSFSVTLDDGKIKRTFFLNHPYQGLYIVPGIWRTLDDFSSGAVCLVLASGKYDETDYIRDYDNFIQYKKTARI